MRFEQALEVFKRGGKISRFPLGGYVRIVTCTGIKSLRWFPEKEYADNYLYSFDYLDIIAEDWEIVDG